MVNRHLFLTTGLTLCCMVILGGIHASYIEAAASSPSTEAISKVNKRNRLQDEGRRLAKAGHYQEAIAMYQAAIAPELVNKEYEKAVAMGAMKEIYIWQKKYEEALRLQRWFLNNSVTGEPTKYALLDKREVEALIEYERQGNPEAIRNFLQDYKEFYARELPPMTYQFGSAGHISTILRLYDTIGDYDAGIAYIDEILAYFKSQDIKKYGEYRPGKVDAEYMKVREAFEAEKRAGGPTCKGQPDCIGDATRALIQSDYFPW